MVKLQEKKSVNSPKLLRKQKSKLNPSFIELTLMREKGLSENDVMKRLKEAQAKDLRYSDGKILSSFCTDPHPIAKKAAAMFFESNLGDPGLFPGTTQLEKKAITSLAKLLHGSNGCCGFIVSGGTEANLLAINVARNKSKINKPELIIPESAHFSFEKICNLLGIKLVKAGSDKSFRVDPDSVEQLINENTVAIVGNAGSAELGTVDPIEELSEIAVRHALPLHVDAAFGGLVLPFLERIGYSTTKFDFEIEGVKSITVDPHKMGMSTIPSGGILFRNGEEIECLRTETPYLTEQYQCTFVGTRPGASAAATWAVFEYLGNEGFEKTVEHCMSLTTLLYEGLEEAKFEVLLRPMMNIVAFRSKNSKILVEKMQKHGWHISYVPRLDCMRVVLMPHSTRQNILDFLQCLRAIKKTEA
jgi:tyrosine decarboxylase / aspartate 1-decarboxylase